MATILPNRHVLVWVDAEFLESEGMLHILQESGVIAGGEQDWEKLVAAAENSGGFALGGMLADSNHGAGIWITPPETLGLEIMIPWHFVRSVVTASEHLQSKMFGLARAGAQRTPGD